MSDPRSTANRNRDPAAARWPGPGHPWSLENRLVENWPILHGRPGANRPIMRLALESASPSRSAQCADESRESRPADETSNLRAEGPFPERRPQRRDETDGRSDRRANAEAVCGVGPRGEYGGEPPVLGTRDTGESVSELSSRERRRGANREMRDLDGTDESTLSDLDSPDRHYKGLIEFGFSGLKPLASARRRPTSNSTVYARPHGWSCKIGSRNPQASLRYSLRLAEQLGNG